MNELQQQLEELVMHRAKPSVSIYMPMEMKGPTVKENPIRLKNLLKKAAELIEEGEVEVLKPLDELVSKESFWRNRAPGLGLFRSRVGTRVIRLPVAPQSLCVVEDRFHLKPLLAILGKPGRFYVLALSRNATRLLEVTRDDVQRGGIGEIPASLSTTLPEDTGQKQLQYHSGGSGATIYHGQGAGEHRVAEDVRRFLTTVDAGLKRSVPDTEAPLVLAGVGELTAVFREITDHPNVATETIEGNVEGLSDKELAARAHPLVDSKLRDKQRGARERIEDLCHTERVISRVDEIVPAAVDGRIEVLFVTKDERCWGTFDSVARSTQVDVEQSEENLDLLDFAAVRTFEKGGSVFVVEASAMPGIESQATALLRY